jgi:hypothetical protein
MGLLIFSILILVSNLLFLIIGVAHDIGLVGAIMGGLAAILTDPLILVIGIVGGAALVIQQIKFPVIALVAGSIVATIIIHFSLGTTRLIVDIVRLDAFLLITSIIIIVASFFRPKTKTTTKKIKVDNASLKAIRILVIIFTATILWFILFYSTQNINHTLFGKYISRPIIYPMHLQRGITWCADKEDKTTCKTIGERELIKSGKITKRELNKQIENGTLQVKYEQMHFGRRRQSQWIAHTIIFIISLLAVWRLRFSIATTITTPLFNMTGAIKKFFLGITKVIKKFFREI